VIEALLQRYGQGRFQPIDVSRSAIEGSARGLLQDYPNLEVHAVADGYLEGLQLLAERGSSPKLILWLGSSIGNFHRSEAGEFLGRVRAHMGPADRLLVGFDLRKDKGRLEAAYDDQAGVTRGFIRNLLTRINRELGGDFPAEEFLYRAEYNGELGRVEMWLESPRELEISLPGLEWSVHFEAGERVHMENSYKYSRQEIAEVGRVAGLTQLQSWTDPDDLFCEALFGLERPPG
jgi:L-histidine N-alpha-methyltransferase